MNTPGAVGRQCCGAFPGNIWGFGALLKALTSVVVLKVEISWLFTPPTDRLEPVTFGLQVRLYPLGHDCHNNNVYESVTEDLCIDLCIIYSIYSCINKEICICNYIVLELQKTNNNFPLCFTQNYQ